MVVAYAWCPRHGRRETALLGCYGLRRCDAPGSDSGHCRHPLTRDRDTELDPELALLDMLERWDDSLGEYELVHSPEAGHAD